MKKQQLHISIPKPCHEKRENMDATDKGAFCHSCRKEVIDFSTMTDRAVIEYLSSAKGVCGIFRRDQIDRTLTLYRPYNGFLNWKVGLIGLLPLLSFKCGPQQPMMGKAIAPTHTEQQPSVKGEPVQSTTNPISGYVCDEFKQPIADAKVTIIDALSYQTYQNTQTDTNGYFIFPKEKAQDHPHQLIQVYHSMYSDPLSACPIDSRVREYQIVLHQQFISGNTVTEPAKKWF